MTYFIVPFAQVTEAMLAEAQENGTGNLRHSKSGEDRVVLKVAGDPSPVFSGFPSYSHMEILPVMRSSEWS